MFKGKKAHDMLEQKKRNLNTYVEEYEGAVSAVTDIIDTLTRTSSNIEQTIAEINEYQQELNDTAEKLQKAKSKNDKVIKNFEALLGD